VTSELVKRGILEQFFPGAGREEALRASYLLSLIQIPMNIFYSEEGAESVLEALYTQRATEDTKRKFYYFENETFWTTVNGTLKDGNKDTEFVVFEVPKGMELLFSEQKKARCFRSWVDYFVPLYLNLTAAELVYVNNPGLNPGLADLVYTNESDYSPTEEDWLRQGVYRLQKGYRPCCGVKFSSEEVYCIVLK